MVVVARCEAPECSMVVRRHLATCEAGILGGILPDLALFSTTVDKRGEKMAV